MEFAPVYSISAIFSMTAQECKTGIEFLAMTEPMMVASRSVQSPDSHKGSRKPLKNAPKMKTKLDNLSPSIFVAAILTRFEESLSESLIQVKVEPLVGINVVPGAREQEEVEETLSHLLVQARRENPGGCVDGSGRPLVWLGEQRQFLPVPELWHDLEGLGQLAAPVLGEDCSNALVHLHDSNKKDIEILIPFRRIIKTNLGSNSAFWRLSTSVYCVSISVFFSSILAMMMSASVCLGSAGARRKAL